MGFHLFIYGALLSHCLHVYKSCAKATDNPAYKNTQDSFQDRCSKCGPSCSKYCDRGYVFSMCCSGEAQIDHAKKGLFAMLHSSYQKKRKSVNQRMKENVNEIRRVKHDQNEYHPVQHFHGISGECQKCGVECAAYCDIQQIFSICCKKQGKKFQSKHRSNGRPPRKFETERSDRNERKFKSDSEYSGRSRRNKVGSHFDVPMDVDQKGCDSCAAECKSLCSSRHRFAYILCCLKNKPH